MVEDDEATLQMVETLLQKDGYLVESFSSSVAALQWLENNVPDLILLDYQLPELNGKEFLLKLELTDKFELYREVPVIILTAYLMQKKEVEKLLKMGVSAFLFKPFGRTELLNIIENILLTVDIRAETDRFTSTINSLHSLQDDPYFLLPFSVLYLDERLFVKNANPKAMEDFAFIIEKINNEPLPTLLERYSLHSTNELQKACFENNNYPYSYMDHFYTPSGVKHAHVTLLESSDLFHDEYRYILIMDFLYGTVKVPDKLVELLSWLEIFPMGIMVVNRPDEVIHMNQFARQKLLIGNEVTMKNLHRYFTPSLLQGIGHVSDKKHPYFMQNEKPISLVESTFDIAILPTGDNATRLIVLLSDYTGLLNKLNEQEKLLARMNSEGDAGEVNMPRSFMKKFAHDIRTPLNTIQGFSKLVVNDLDPELNRQAVEDLEVINRHSIAVGIMVDKMMDMVKINDGELTLLRKSVDINRLLDKIIKHLEPFCLEKKVDIRFTKGQIPPVLADETVIHKSIYYVMENAVIFNLRPEERVVKVVTGIKDDKYIYLKIADNGPGIPPDELVRVTEPYYYGTPVKERVVKGFGIGLFVANTYINAHGGKLRIESIPEQGSLVEINLPIL